MDTTRAELFLGAMERQLPFVASKTINATALDVQKFQRAHQRLVFEVRNTRFIDNAVKIKPFASKSSLAARVQIDPPGGRDRATVLTQHEQAGIKRPRDGSHLTVPVAVRRSRRGAVVRSQRPRALRLRRQGRAIKGEKRTFVIPNVGIFQRLGRGKRSRTRLIFVFKRSVPIKKRLDFIENARKIVPRVLSANFHREFVDAKRTARRAA